MLEPAGRFAWREAGGLVLILLACLPPMLAGLGGRDTTHTMENLAVFSSQETWLRLHGYEAGEIEAEPGAWAMPSRNDRPRLRKPPGVVWVNLLAWAGLEPGDAGATPARLLLRARLASVAMGLVLIAGVYGVGRSLGDRRTAALAALAAGTMLLVQKQARYASYDIYMAAWVAVGLGVAPLRSLLVGAVRDRWADAARWLVAGAAVGLGWMCKGPLAAGVFGVAVMGVMVAAGGRERDGVAGAWRRGGTGLVIAAVAACVVAVPWYVWAQLRYDLLAAMGREAAHVAERSSPPWFYAGLLGLVFPWTVWLIGGLFLPWLRLGGARRRQALAAWWMFVAILVMFTIPSAKQQRYILPIVPAAAVLIAQLWRWHAELARAGEDDPGGGALRWPHAVMLLGGAAAFAPFVFLQPRLVAWGVFDHPEVGPLQPAATVAASAGMLLAGGLVARWTLVRDPARQRPLAAAGATAAWMVVFATAWWAAYAGAPDGVHPVREPARRLAEVTAHAPVRSYITDDLDEAINEELLFYAQRIMPRVTEADGLRNYAAGLLMGGRVGYVVSPVGEPRDAALESLGFEPLFTFPEDDDREASLWRFGGPPAPGEAAPGARPQPRPQPRRGKHPSADWPIQQGADCVQCTATPSPSPSPLVSRTPTRPCP